MRECTQGSGYGVTSTLCYGVQWDAALRFIKNYYNVSKSSTWGNYINKGFNYEGEYCSETSEFGQLLSCEWLTPETATKEANTSLLVQTGACSSNQAKNIYDLAGGLTEWTMEESGSSNRVCRGGNYYSQGAFCPASFRNSSGITGDGNSGGFRIALYITSAPQNIPTPPSPPVDTKPSKTVK